MRGRARSTLALMAVGACVAACGALQGLDKFEKCNSDEECALTGGEMPDGPTVNDDGPASSIDGPGTPNEAGCGDTLTDPNNCGACGKVCATGFTCSAGKCGCTKTVCGGSDAGGDGGGDAGPLACVDTKSDTQHCGGCGTTCSFANAVPKCTSSTCGIASCAVGFTDCDKNMANGCECAADSCLTGNLCAKRVFTTSLKYDGNLGGLAGADMKCNTLAAAAGLPGKYRAWLSDSIGGSPDTRFTKASIPYRLVDGTLLANNYADLTDGVLLAPLNKTEANALVPTNGFCGPDRTPVSSSTLANGTAQPNAQTCTNWTDATVGGSQWAAAELTTGALGSFCSGGTCNGPYLSPFYCFQQ